MADFGISTAVIGLANTLRGAITTGYTDAHTWKRYKTYWKNVDNRLSVHFTAFESWQKKWMFYKDVHIAKSMYEDFWGEEGFRKIKEGRDQLEEDAGALKRYLDNTGYGEGTRREGIRATMSYSFRKAWFVLATHISCDHLVISIEKGIPDLERLANSYWKRQRNPNLPPSPELHEEIIYHHAIKRGLAIFATETRDRADALFQAYSEAKVKVKFLEMTLDLLSVYSDTKHIHAIAAACEMHLPEFVVVARISNEEEGTVMFVKEELPPEQGDNAADNTVLPIPQAFKDAAKGRSARFAIPTNANGKSVLFSLSHDHLHHQRNSKRTVLELLSTGQFGPEKRELLKLKLAYELSVAYFMLYRCNSLSEVCLCSLRSAMRNNDSSIEDPEQVEFTIETGFTANGHCTCHSHQIASLPNAQPITAPLRRLGLLLIQIAANGRCVTVDEVDRDGKIQKLKLDGKVYDLTNPSDYDGLIDEIKRGLGDVNKLGDALMLCLRQGLTTHENPNDKEMMQGLETFYDEVVKV